ncbi:MAG TPA: PA domain-containing protein, partial [Thermoleophilaceae bacterium]|nr:PA domain-containing protein [Thermoleophilaceae bacterium]
MKAPIAGALLVLVVAAVVLALAGGDDAGERSAAGSERSASAAARAPGEGAERGPQGAAEPGSGALRANGRPSLSGDLTALQRIADRHGGQRAAGTGGDAASVRHVAARLRGGGWRVRLQVVRFPYFRQQSRPRLSVAGARRLRAGRDFRTIAYSGSGSLAAGRLRVVRGQGCDERELSAVERGEVVLVRRGRCLFLVKARAAARAGAAALLVYDSEEQGEPPSATLGRVGTRIPVLMVSGRAGTQLAARDGARVRLAVRALSE